MEIRQNINETEYYSIEKINEIINEYHHHRLSLKQREKEKGDEMRSFGVTCLGIGSTLPRGNAITKSVENEAIRLAERSKYWDKIRRDMTWLENRLYVVTEPSARFILLCKLQGYSITEIARRASRSRAAIYRELDNIAEMIYEA